MKNSLLLLFALAVPFAPTPARAEAVAPSSVDAGRLIILDRGTPVGYEDFAYERRGDSLLVSGVHTRVVQEAAGSTAKWIKKFTLIVDGTDFGMREYTSNLEFGGSVTVKGVMPGDTSMTVYSEVDGAGEALRLEQPPGRLFIMDPMLFTLFDVICRNVSRQSLAKRPVEMVTLGEKPATVHATATAAGPDTIQWGGKRMIARRYVLADDSNSFALWVSPTGQMLRLVHQGGTLEVLREEPKKGSKPKSK
jgi:hypothetical protein